MQYLWSQPSTSSSNEDEDDPNAPVCAVCLDILKPTNVSITACGHKYCTSCLLLSLKTKNTCPTCRAEIEPARQNIEPVSASVAAELIRDEERAIDMTRRIDVINSFSGRNGKSAMIFSLCREIAFATAHGIARWQKTTDATYHNSWIVFDPSDDDDDQTQSNE
jgi:hypothetical protein